MDLFDILMLAISAAQLIIEITQLLLRRRKQENE